jgi:hypothetical protein
VGQPVPRLKVIPDGFRCRPRSRWVQRLVWAGLQFTSQYQIRSWWRCLGIWAKASISGLSELAREAGETQPVGLHSKFCRCDTASGWLISSSKQGTANWTKSVRRFFPAEDDEPGSNASTARRIHAWARKDHSRRAARQCWQPSPARLSRFAHSVRGGPVTRRRGKTGGESRRPNG